MIYVLSFVRNAQQTRQSNVLESLLSVVVGNLKINRVQKADTYLPQRTSVKNVRVLIFLVKICDFASDKCHNFRRSVTG